MSGSHFFAIPNVNLSLQLCVRALLPLLVLGLFGAAPGRTTQTAKPQTADDYFKRGNDYRNKNDYEKAIADYTEALRLGPQLVKAYFNTQLDELCARLDNSYECAKAIEAHQLKNSEHASRVIRRGGELRLKLDNGRWQTLKDYQKANEDDSVIHYNFRDYLPELGYFLVHRQFYEGRDYLMIHDASGRRFELQDVPVVSPDRRRLVTTSNGIMGGYEPNAIQIWRATQRGLVLEQTIKPQGWGPSGAKWIDNQRISVTKNLPSAEGSTTRQASATLVLRGKWRVEQQ